MRLMYADGFSVSPLFAYRTFAYDTLIVLSLCISRLFHEILWGRGNSVRTETRYLKTALRNVYISSGIQIMRNVA